MTIVEYLFKYRIAQGSTQSSLPDKKQQVLTSPNTANQQSMHIKNPWSDITRKLSIAVKHEK